MSEKREIGLPTIVAGVITGLFVAGLIRLCLNPTKQMPHRMLWRRWFAVRYGESEAIRLTSHMQQIYNDLYRRRPRHRHPALRYHVTFQILPALALYQTLREMFGENKEALVETEKLVWAEIEPLYRRALWFLPVLPDPFPAWRRLVYVAMATVFPPAGWQTRQVVNDGYCYGFDITRCVYLETLEAFGAVELTPVFCKMDDLMACLVPESIVWQRAGTLALGEDHCDFRWCRHSQ